MNTQTRVYRLHAGQALQLPHASGTAVLTQGELRLQAPARWLGESLVVAEPVRLAAPARLPDDAWSSTIVADTAATLRVIQPAPLLSANALPLLAAWLRRRTAR